MIKIVLSALLLSLTFADMDTKNGTTVLDEEGQVQAIISKGEDGYSIECGEKYNYVGSDMPYQTESVTNDCEPKE